MKKYPSPEDIVCARITANLTQTKASELISSKLRTWQDWESGKSTMHPGLWELFLIKSGNKK